MKKRRKTEAARKIMGRSALAGEDLGRAGVAVKEGVVGCLKGINEIGAKIVTIVRNTVSSTLRMTGDVAKESVTITKDVVKVAIAASEEVGTGLIFRPKSVAKGIIMGAGDSNCRSG